MIDRHAVHALKQASLPTKQIAQQMGVSERSVQRIAKEPAIEGASDAQARRRRGVGRPAVPDPVRHRLRELIAADPAAPAMLTILLGCEAYCTSVERVRLAWREVVGGSRIAERWW